MFNDYYETLANQHQIKSRNGHNLLYILDYHRDIAAASIRIAGAKVWSNLNNNHKNIPNVKSFKAQLKKKLKISSYNVTH